MPLEGGVNGGHRQHFEGEQSGLDACCNGMLLADWSLLSIPSIAQHCVTIVDTIHIDLHHQHNTTAAHVHPDHRQSVFADLSVTAHHSTPKAYSGPSSTLDRPAETPLAESSSQTSSTSAARHHHHQQQQQQRRSDLPPLPPDSSHASPLSSYNRPPMPGSPPGAPLSLSPPMTHVATLDNGPISIDLNSPASSDAAVSAQILNLANMIVSPVPQSGLDRETASSMLGEQHSRPQRQQQQRHRGDIDRADGGLIGTYGPSTSNGAVPRPQSSFSIIDDPQSASRRRTSSSHRRQASDESDPNSNSPPKPKLRNLDTSMLAARSKVSSFFGGLSDSLGSAGGHTQSQQQQPQQQQHQQQQRQNSTNAQQYATPSTSSHNNHAPQISYDHAPQSIPSRQASPQPRPSSSYPSTSHMQPPPSSAAQTRSLSQPLQHQQQIPEYAIPQQHGQQPSISSTATGSSTNLHPRSSFYGLDAHTQQQSVAGEDTQQAQRWRGERRASPSTIGSNSRPASRSVPRSSDTGHYPSPSLGAASSIGGGYTGSNEGAPRRRVASWATRSNTSSVYGLSMTAPHLAPSPSADLPSAPSVAHLSQAHLRPGHGVSLLSHQKTLDMYRANVKKTNDPEVTFELAQFMLGLAREMAIQELSSNSGGHPMAPGMTGMSDENLLASLNGHHHQDGDSSPSPDPSFSFHSRSSGSSGDLASAATGLAANGRAVSSQGIPSHPSNPINAAGLQKRRGSHSPSPSMSTTRLGMNRTGSPVSAAGASVNDRKALVAEAVSLLKRSADRGHVASQFFLADIYANGGMESQKSNRASIYALLPGNSSHGNAQGGGSGSGNVSPMETKMNPSPTGSAASLTAPPFFNPTSSSLNPSSSQQQHQKPDFDKALPLFIAAAKHGHAPSCFRAGECFENGWGCRKDSNKAVQFYRKSAASSFPEAMYRLGMAELNGELGLKDRQKEGFKWLKQVAALAESNNENANTSNSGAQDAISAFSSSPSGGFGLSMDEHDGNGSNSNQGTRLCTVQALHELALLHERGIDNVVFVDNEYAAELLARASELGYAPSAYKLGECYEYGRMGCPQDAALSIHYYSELAFIFTLSFLESCYRSNTDLHFFCDVKISQHSRITEKLALL